MTSITLRGNLQLNNQMLYANKSFVLQYSYHPVRPTVILET